MVARDYLQEWIWVHVHSGDSRALRTMVKSLRRNADNPTNIFTGPRVGYQMPEGETQEQEES